MKKCRAYPVEVPRLASVGFVRVQRTLQVHEVARTATRHRSYPCTHVRDLKDEWIEKRLDK